MAPRARRVVGVILGVLLALAITFVVETLNGKLYPPPPGTDFADPASVKAAMAMMPKAALGVVLAGWALAALAGTWLAARFAHPSGWPPLTVGIILLAAAVMNMYMIPHPLWFWLLGVAIYPVATWVGARLGGTPVSPRTP
jgi:hypothetical protein